MRHAGQLHRWSKHLYHPTVLTLLKCSKFIIQKDRRRLQSPASRDKPGKSDNHREEPRALWRNLSPSKKPVAFGRWIKCFGNASIFFVPLVPWWFKRVKTKSVSDVREILGVVPLAKS